MRKPRGLKSRQYVFCLIKFNEYLALLSWVKLSDKNGVTELNEILWKSMPKSWSKQACMQGFYWNYITRKREVNMFEHMEIVEYIYEVIVEPS